MQRSWIIAIIFILLLALGICMYSESAAAYKLNLFEAYGVHGQTLQLVH